MNQTNTPATLNKMCTVTARLASMDLPIEASQAVKQVPILAPKIRAIPASRGKRPWLASTMTIPVVAEELWTRAVKAAPKAMPNSGAFMFFIKSMKGA